MLGRWRLPAVTHRAARFPRALVRGWWTMPPAGTAALPDFDWAVLPEGVMRGEFEAPSGTLATIAAGDPGKPRVLLVPGATGSKEDFILMLPELAAAGYFVLSCDIAGQYESAQAGPENLVPPRNCYDYELFRDDLLAMLDTDQGAVHVVGYSFAAVVAQLAFVQRPEKFRSLTLISCPPEPGQSLRYVRLAGWCQLSGSTQGRHRINDLGYPQQYCPGGAANGCGSSGAGSRSRAAPRSSTSSAL